MSSAVESISFEGMVQKTFENQKSVLYTSAKRAVAMNFKYSVGPFEKAMDAGALLSINGAVQPALECAANGDPNWNNF